jgi:predicted dithiol-disulfide oxidoreductase (DUF899 family)
VGELTKEIWIDAPPEKVYRYLVEPELTVRWFGDESWNDPDVAIVAKAPIAQFAAWGQERGWRFSPLYSSSPTTFNRDYNAESDEAGQLPIAHVFTRTDGRIHHRWSSELFAAPPDPGQHPRHVDYMWPIWKVLDVTPDGRGTDWHPRYRYDT